MNSLKYTENNFESFKINASQNYATNLNIATSISEQKTLIDFQTDLKQTCDAILSPQFEIENFTVR